MQRLQGIAVSPGVAIGEALVIDTEGFRIPQRFVSRSTVDSEVQRLSAAIDAAAGEISANRDAINRELGEQYAAIFTAHLAMLQDPKLRSEIEEIAASGKSLMPEGLEQKLSLQEMADLIAYLRNVGQASRLP